MDPLPNHATDVPGWKTDLFLASFLALFMEVMFIRWVPSYERVLAYFTNFVLIASFLGLGLGSMLARWRRDLMRYEPLLVLLLVVVALGFNLFVKTQTLTQDVLYTDINRAALLTVPLLFTLVIFFLLITATFMPLGQKIGAGLLTTRSTLNGYILNILGSVLGVVAFSAVSFLQLSPGWWFGLALLPLLWFVRREKVLLCANLVAVLIIITNVAVAGGGFVWSPYHKITASPLAILRSTGQLSVYNDPDQQAAQVLPPEFGFHVAVDEDFLQMALNLSPAAVARYPFLRHNLEHYDLAYRIPNFPYKDVLIVGAGTGNDTAAALRHGAQHVDAVEIDPAIVQLGRSRHPEHPYDDPRVTVYVDDARSFFHKTTHRYDMVVFGLLDSHRLFSSMSSVRLDSFVFTVESFREVRGLLKDQGLVVVEHGLGAPFMEARMYAILTEAYGMAPAMSETKETPGYTFITGPGLRQYLGVQQPQSAGLVEPATDDWPFLYLEGRELPRQYGIALVTLLTISLASVFGCSGGRLRRIDLHFFFLGSAFLLIETLSVTRFALLFGSTWVVNSIVFTAILLVILLANLIMQRLSTVNLRLCYTLLAISILVNFLYPIHDLLGVRLWLRLVVAMVLMGSPLFFAAFVFAHSFKRSATPDLAFASNLLGAVVGGLAEYSTLIIGFRHQLLVALVMYALSYAALLGKRKAPLLATLPG